MNPARLLIILICTAGILSAHEVSPMQISLTVGGDPGTIILANDGGEFDCTTDATISVYGDSGSVTVDPLSAHYYTDLFGNGPTAASFKVTPVKAGRAFVTVALKAGGFGCFGAKSPAAQVDLSGGSKPATAGNNPGAEHTSDPISNNHGGATQEERNDVNLGGPPPLPL